MLNPAEKESNNANIRTGIDNFPFFQRAAIPNRAPQDFLEGACKGLYFGLFCSAAETILIGSKYLFVPFTILSIIVLLHGVLIIIRKIFVKKRCDCNAAAHRARV